jgi:hypothetical protein
VTDAENPQVKPSPTPRSKSATAGVTTQKTAAERLLGVADDRPPTKPKKRGRDRVVEFLGFVWDRSASYPELGWALAHECLASPERLAELRAEHAAQDARVSE